jgi:hypothetical protein
MCWNRIGNFTNNFECFLLEGSLSESSDDNRTQRVTPNGGHDIEPPKVLLKWAVTGLATKCNAHVSPNKSLREFTNLHCRVFCMKLTCCITSEIGNKLEHNWTYRKEDGKD